MAGVNGHSFLLAKHLFLDTDYSLLIPLGKFTTFEPSLLNSQCPIFPLGGRGGRAQIRYHVARKDAYRIDELDPNAQVSFCPRGQDMASAIMTWRKNELHNRRCLEEQHGRAEMVKWRPTCSGDE